MYIYWRQSVPGKQWQSQFSTDKISIEKFPNRFLCMILKSTISSTSLSLYVVV